MENLKYIQSLGCIVIINSEQIMSLRSNKAFILLWTITSVIGWSVGMFMSQTIFIVLLKFLIVGPLFDIPSAFSFLPGVNEFSGILMLAVSLMVNWSFIGVPVTGLQWLILKHRVIWADYWFASVGGWTLGGGLSGIWLGATLLLSYQSKDLLQINKVIIGIIIGFSQWLILRKYYFRAGWWIFLCGGIWAFGHIVASYGASMVLCQLSIPTTLYRIADPTTIEFDMVSAILDGFLIGLTTGLLLLSLAKRAKSSASQT